MPFVLFLCLRFLLPVELHVFVLCHHLQILRLVIHRIRLVCLHLELAQNVLNVLLLLLPYMLDHLAQQHLLFWIFLPFLFLLCLLALRTFRQPCWSQISLIYRNILFFLAIFLGLIHVLILLKYCICPFLCSVKWLRHCSLPFLRISISHLFAVSLFLLFFLQILLIAFRLHLCLQSPLLSLSYLVELFFPYNIV